jgi:CRISPR-associated protein Csm2
MALKGLESVNDLAILNSEDIDSIAENVVKIKQLNEIKTNQIRNIFSSISKQRNEFKKVKYGNTEEDKKILEKIKGDIILLKPMLAYAAGRQKSVKSYQEFMKDVIDKTVKSKDLKSALKNFFLLSEAVIAYHKFYGGKE